jgi:hypothetical protein
MPCAPRPRRLTNRRGSRLFKEGSRGPGPRTSTRPPDARRASDKKEVRVAGNFAKIAKDGLQALVVWAVISAVLVYFFGYPGWIFSQLIGFVFLVAFCSLRFAQLAAWVMGLLGFKGGGAPPPMPPMAPGQTSGHGPTSRPCSTCGGSGRMTCPSCGGMRERWEGPTTANGTGQSVRCGYCTGSGSVQCTSC